MQGSQRKQVDLKENARGETRTDGDENFGRYLGKASDLSVRASYEKGSVARK